LAAVKYKLFMDEEIKRQGLKYKTLVAFSGSIDFEGEVFTEESMNRVHNPKRLKTEEVFELDDQIRFLIVANKFQTGFDEPLLHTMFLDKPVRDRTAVQTLSRLNRIHQDKKDTLVVDFTGSYEQIMKAYSKYQDDVTTHKSSDPNQLYELKAALLRFGIFTESEIREVAELGRSKGAGNMPAIAGMTFAIKKQFDSVLSRENRDEFRILMNRYLAIFNYIQAIFHIPNQDLWDFQIFMIYLKNKLTNSDYNSLKKELEDVEVVNHSIHEVERDDEDSQEETGGSSSGGSTNVTKVRETRTVKEVIEEINLRFKERIGDNGVEVIGEFLELVTTDEEMIQTMKANIEKDPDKVFEEIFLDRFKAELTVIVMDKAPERYSEITGEPVFPYICKTAYKLLRIEAQAA